MTTTCIKWAIDPFIHTPEGFPRVDDPILVQIEECNVLLEHGVAMVLVPWGSMGVLSVHSLQRSWHICITTNNITLTQSELGITSGSHQDRIICISTKNPNSNCSRTPRHSATYSHGARPVYMQLSECLGRFWAQSVEIHVFPSATGYMLIA
jgi:hypothetical protein